MALVLQSLLGLIVIPLMAWLLSEDRRALPFAIVVRFTAMGIALQFIIAGLFILVPPVAGVFALLTSAITSLQAATGEGMKFLFGYLAGGPSPFPVADPSKRFLLALQALPMVVIVSVLSQLLYHWGIMQRVVGFLGRLLMRTMGVSGALGTTAAANIFVGMVEAPLLARPYLETMSRGGLFAVMTTGMATVAGTVMALYASFLEPVLPGAAGHLLVASLMSAPAALLLARLMVPWGDDERPSKDAGSIADQPGTGSAMDAIATGTTHGVRLLVSIAAMLLVMVALVALANMALGAVTAPLGLNLSVEKIFGWAATPLALIIGIEWNEAAQAGQLIGVKTVLNEFLAYVQLSATAPDAMSERTRLILTYALCGFANFGSLGIMIGGLIAMCPARRADILALGPRSLISGTLATLMTGAVIGVITLPS